MRPTPANTSRNNGIMHGTPTHVVRSLKRPYMRQSSGQNELMAER